MTETPVPDGMKQLRVVVGMRRLPFPVTPCSDIWPCAMVAGGGTMMLGGDESGMRGSLMYGRSLMHILTTGTVVDKSLGLTEDQKMLQAMADDFAENELAPHAAEWDEKHIMPIDVFKKAGELGFGGMYVRDDVGGMFCRLLTNGEYCTLLRSPDGPQRLDVYQRCRVHARYDRT